MEYRVGDFYYYHNMLCELLNIAETEYGKNILIGLPDISNRGTPITNTFINKYHSQCDKKHYNKFSYFPTTADYLTPAYKKVKSNRLSRKMFPKARVSDCKGFLYILNEV